MEPMQALAQRLQKIFSVPEWIYVQQAKLGDREAFGKLYQLYLDKIYRYVYFRVGQNKELAEDLASDVFVKAWEKLGQYKEGSFQAWIYAIARNTVIDNYRTQKQHVALTETIADEKQNHEEEIFKKLEIEKIKQALSKLTDEQQEIITLKFINDVPNTQIADIMGKREDAVRALQSRAIKALQELLV